MATRREPSFRWLGWALIVWTVVSWEAYHIPGTRWLGEHAPVWIAWASIGLWALGLAVIVVMGRLGMTRHRLNDWIAVAALGAFMSQSLLLSVWLKYSTVGILWGVGAVGIVGVLLLAFLRLRKRFR